MLAFRCRHQYASGFSFDVSFETEHRVTALFGPSGSGKTSVLNIVSGLLHAQEGLVRLDDHTLFDSAKSINLRPEQRRTGYVFQDSLLLPHKSVEGNLAYGLRRRGNSSPAIGWDRVVDVLELRPLLQRLPRTLSGGERQRVALGRALLSQPRILLLDEPWSALDDSAKDRVLDYLERALAEWQLPALLVSHDRHSLRRLAEWVVAIDGGRVQQTGPVNEVVR
jgi:molybdate transport system ATP-binding protein